MKLFISSYQNTFSLSHGNLVFNMSIFLFFFHDFMSLKFYTRGDALQKHFYYVIY